METLFLWNFVGERISECPPPPSPLHPDEKVGTIGEREDQIESRVAALERKLLVDAEGAKAAAAKSAAERKRKLLDRLMRQTIVLRNTLIADGMASGTQGTSEGEVEAVQEEDCWAEVREDVARDGGGSGGDGQAADEEELILTARARYINAMGSRRRHR